MNGQFIRFVVLVALASIAQFVVADETEIWQTKIDSVAAAGGGCVSVPPGRHLVGQLDLKSNVELRLEKGAVLEGLVGLEHYRVTTLPYSEGTWSAIVSAIGVTNVAITGEGEIFGNGQPWKIPEDYGGNQEGLRARGIFFADSERIRLSGFTLRDAACWGVVFKCCRHVRIKGVTIDNHANSNNDGFDIEASDVVIEDCDVDAGDDAYCLKSNNPHFVVENVTVRNCIARSHSNGCKIGTATHGTIRNVLFENIVCRAPRRDFIDNRKSSPNFGKPHFFRPELLHLPSGGGLGAVTIECVDGGRVENVIAKDIEVSGFIAPIFVRAGTRTGRDCGTPPGSQYVFRNIRIENVHGQSETPIASSISGVDGCRVKNIVLKDIDIICPGTDAAGSRQALETPVPDVSGLYPECTMFRPSILPAYGLYVDRVDGLTMENVRFSLGRGSEDIRPPVYLTTNVTNVEQKGVEDLCRFVDSFIGTAGTGHTTPAACVPFGMVQAGPDTGFGDWEHCNGYIYGDKTICGFTQTHLNGTGCPDLGDLRLMLLPGRRGRSPRPTDCAVEFDKESERAEPGYYAVTLPDPAVRVEIAAAEHSAIYRFMPKKAGEMRLVVEPKALFYNPPEFPKRPNQTLAFDVVRDEKKGVIGLSGAYRTTCWVARDVGYRVEFDRAGRCDGVDAYAFDLKVGEPLVVKVGLSSRSADGARRNLAAEIPGWDFDAVKNAARRKWNAVLGAAVIEGTEEQKKNWYTSLYHLCVQPNNIADVGEKSFYSTFSCWDTFRAAGPLYTILYPEKAAQFVDSMLEQGKKTGCLPIWTLWGEDNQCMIGTHSVPMIVDAWLKGCWPAPRGEDAAGTVAAAYNQIKETLTKKHEGRIKGDWDLYDRYGYYPFDKIRGESVSRTMECAYDDWCAGVMAEKLGHKEDAAFFFKRSVNWKNIFDTSLGLVRGKDTKGDWREPFDPYALGHGADLDNDFTEGNAFQYSWHVMQDVPGLVAAMGGKEKFVEKLDALFKAPPKTEGMGCLVDITGLIGQYVHGNEPSHHVIYFYPQVGEPEKAAERIREVFDKFYLPKPDGLCGNDDCGQMSAWYLFSAMGFYPFNPCGGEYIIGAPQVPTAQVKVGGEGEQRTFRVLAKGLSKENKYVKSVTLNGKPVTNWKIRHADIVKGGELVFEMGNGDLTP